MCEKSEIQLAMERDAARAKAAAMAEAKMLDDLRRDAGRYRKMREASTLLKLYVYEDSADPCSGDWLYKPSAQDVDLFADGLGAPTGEKP
jgi:hypothetical protein